MSSCNISDFSKNLNLTNKLISNLTKVNQNQKIEIELLKKKVEQLQLENKLVVKKNLNLSNKLKAIEQKQFEKSLK